MKSIFKKVYFFNFDLLPTYSNEQKRHQRLLLINYFFVIAVPVIIINDIILAISGKQAYTFEKYPVLIFWMICLFSLYLVIKKHYFPAKLIIAFVSIGFISSYSLTGYIIGEHFLWQPIMLLGISVIPFLIFDFEKEKIWLLISFLLCLVYVIFHDDIMLYGSEDTFDQVFNRLNTTPFIYISVKILIFLFLTFIIFYSIRLNDHQQLINEQINNSLKKTSEYLGRANAELQAHRNAINNSASLLIANQKQHIDSVNDIFLDVSGYNREELMGKPLIELVLAYYDKAFYETILQTLWSEGVWRGELKLRQKEGGFFWMQTAISTIKDKDDVQKGFLVIMFNITDLKNNDDRLEKLNQEKDRVLYAVAHDLKGPMMNLKAMLDMIKAGHIKEQELDGVFGLMSKDCEHSTSLITELLDIGRLENVNFILTKSATDLTAFLSTSIERYAQKAREKDIIIQTSFDKNIKLVDINEKEFFRVIYNLLTNAIKFTPRGGEISINTKKIDDHHISIEVVDTGVGISHNLMPFIFDKFSKAGRLGIEGEKSTGLGMWVVKYIIQLHGGSISVQSEEMKGTTCTILMPC